MYTPWYSVVGERRRRRRRRLPSSDASVLIVIVVVTIVVTVIMVGKVETVILDAFVGLPSATG